VTREALQNVRCAVVCPIANGGGITEAFLTSLEMLKAHAITPVAIVPEAFLFLDRLTATGCEIHRLFGLELGGALNVFWQAWSIARAARIAKANILILNNGRHVEAVKRRLRNIPMVAIYHGGKTKRFLAADRVITINDDQLQYLVRAGYPPQRACVVDNALPVEALEPYQPKPRHTDGPVVGSLRLLEPAKGVDVLIEAVAILAARGRRIRTRIGSSGSQEQELRNRVSSLGLADLIEFTGWVGNKAKFLESLDIYVLPSRAEEWGIGIVEANAARLPVIATACLGPKRIVKDGETGILVPIDDPVAMAEAIQQLADDPEHCERLARRAHMHAEANYILPRIAPLFVSNVVRVLYDNR